MTWLDTSFCGHFGILEQNENQRNLTSGKHRQHRRDHNWYRGTSLDHNAMHVALCLFPLLVFFFFGKIERLCRASSFNSRHGNTKAWSFKNLLGRQGHQIFEPPRLSLITTFPSHSSCVSRYAYCMNLNWTCAMIKNETWTHLQLMSGPLSLSFSFALSFCLLSG